jgi:hypothetical protein
MDYRWHYLKSDISRLAIGDLGFTSLYQNSFQIWQIFTVIFTKVLGRVFLRLFELDIAQF